MEPGTSRTICVLAGDVSGDRSAAGLARAIRERAPDVRLVGVGGAAMRGAGVDVQLETTDLSFVGVLSSLRFLGPLLARYRRTRRMILEERPDVVVLVDAEAVALPLSRWLYRIGIPTVFFFPPQVWFWGRWRLAGIVARRPMVLSTFREEAELYRAAGVETQWVGHPLRDAVRVSEDPDRAMRRIGLDPSRPLVVLMPGSRRTEIRSLAPAMLGAARRLQERNPALQFAIPLASESLREELEQQVAGSGLAATAIYRPDSYAVLSRARVVIQSSGTATLETALLGIPSVIAYRCIPLEYYVARRFLMSVPFIGMVNILLGEMVQPEFFQKNVDAGHLAAEAWSLLTDDVRRASIQSRLGALGEILGPPGAFERSARAVLGLLSSATEGKSDPAIRRAGTAAAR